MDRSRATVTWEQGSMEIQGAESGNIEKRLGQNLTIGHDHKKIGRPALDFFYCLVRANARRLQRDNAMGQRQLLDRARSELQTSPGRPVRLGDRPDHLDSGHGEQKAQSWKADVPAAEKDSSHCPLLHAIRHGDAPVPAREAIPPP
jgi:hypothetical protein